MKKIIGLVTVLVVFGVVAGCAGSVRKIVMQTVDHSKVLEPTDYVAGDKVLTIGGVEIRMLYLGLSHTDTLYAFHIPSERVVFTADLGLMRAVAPVGVPDRYAPGYLAAMDRIIAIDFDTFIPSHFGFGRKQDLIDWRSMLEDGRRLARKAIQSYGTPGLGSNQMGQFTYDKGVCQYLASVK